MPDKNGNGRRLDSWKDIALYLNKDVRTVIRWEKTRNLPVHRIPGGQRNVIFAYKHELDEWLTRGENGNEAPQKLKEIGESPPASRNQDFPPSKRQSAFFLAPGFRKWIVPLIAGCLLSSLFLSMAWVRLRSAPNVHPLSFKRLTDDGRNKGNLRTDGKMLYFNETRGARMVLVAAPISGSPLRLIDTPFANAMLQDLSKDGRTLLITSLEGIAREGPLWAMATEGGPPRRIGDVLCAAARYSPDNQKIACTAWNTVVLMDTDGTHRHTLFSFVFPVGQVAWTPDGTRLRTVLEENAPNTYTPWELAVNQNGTETAARKLPLGTNCCLDWAWIEDGKVAVYVRVDQEGKRHAVTAPENYSLDGKQETELSVKVGEIVGLDSIRTGRTLYLATSNASHGELWKFDARTGEFKAFLTGMSAAYLAYSPDGKWITYRSTEDGSLFRSRADGSEALQLTKPPMYVEVSSWSPDGRHIAFTGRQPGRPFRIYLIDRDGGIMQEAAEGNDAQGGPSWSPDGKALVYGNVLCEELRDCWIRRLDLATRTTEIIPGSHGCRTARWSPDGKYIAALHLPTYQLMLFDVNAHHWKMLADSVTGDNINWASDSRAVYVDSPREKKSIIERIAIKDGDRHTIVTLANLERGAGMTDGWIGLAPDN